MSLFVKYPDSLSLFLSLFLILSYYLVRSPGEESRIPCFRCARWEKRLAALVKSGILM